jgi:site-specific recombinase XerD
MTDLEPIIKQVSLLFRKHNLTYDETRRVIAEARKQSDIGFVKKKPSLPVIPSTDDIDKLLKAAECNITHWAIIQLLLSTGCRVSELINVKVEHIYYQENMIFVLQGKTGDRFVLYPESLSVHIRNMASGKRPDQYLITSSQYKKFTRAGIWKMIKKYGRLAGIEKNLHPHIFRHYFCTKLTGLLTEGELMLLTGHASKETLQIYQHLSVESFNQKFQTAFK